jgi:alpha-tubulin suppressor-like RCC1 family protein
VSGSKRVSSVVLAWIFISSCKHSPSPLASGLSSEQGNDGLEYFYWTNEDYSILYRGRCQPGFEQDIGLCYRDLSWVDSSDVKLYRQALEADKKKVAEALQEVELIRQYDADNPRELDKANFLERDAKRWAVEAEKGRSEFESRYSAFVNMEVYKPKRILQDRVVIDRFREGAFRPQSISAGGGHTCALLQGGEVKCWGHGEYGQLGQGSVVNIGRMPGDMAGLQAVFLGKRAISVSVGSSHSCALLEHGDVKCWGGNVAGELGQDTDVNIGDKPEDMLKLRPIRFGKKALWISAGSSYTCALLEGGEVKCWGYGEFGQLGQDSEESIGYNGGDMDRLNPVKLGNRTTYMSAGQNHICALLVGGEVKCWGSGLRGILGQDSPENIGNQFGDMEKLQPVFLGKRALSVSSGGYHSCALLEGGEIKCWGSGNVGQLAQDSDDDVGDAPGDMAKLQPIRLGGRALSVSAGFVHTCALLEGGEVKCWGWGDKGALGQDSAKSIGNKAGDMAKLQPVFLGKKALSVSAGQYYTCALLEGGTVKCWGTESGGGLGQDEDKHIGDKPGDMEKLQPIKLGKYVMH